MFSVKNLLPLTLFLVAVTATSPLAKRQDPSTTCGDNYYSSDQVTDAANAACGYVQNGGEAGSSDYPHQYEDYEGFSFGGVPSPYYEFPIQEDGIYTGGSPGADRVIINGDCEYAGVITHTGASGDDFVACSGTS